MLDSDDEEEDAKFFAAEALRRQKYLDAAALTETLQEVGVLTARPKAATVRAVNLPEVLANSDAAKASSSESDVANNSSSSDEESEPKRSVEKHMRNAVFSDPIEPPTELESSLFPADEELSPVKMVKKRLRLIESSDED